MAKFIIFYIIMIIALFEFFYWTESPMAKSINDFQTNLTLGILEPFLKAGQLRGADIIITPQYKLVVTQACNGLIPFFIFFAAILAFPSPIINRLFWIVVGYITFFIVNIFRLLIVTYYVTKTPGNFEMSHDLYGNILLMVTGIVLFYFYLKSSRYKF